MAVVVFCLPNCCARENQLREWAVPTTEELLLLICHTSGLQGQYVLGRRVKRRNTRGISSAGTPLTRSTLQVKHLFFFRHASI